MATKSITFGKHEVNIFGNVYPNSQNLGNDFLIQMFGTQIPLEIQKDPTARNVARYVRQIGIQALRDCQENG